MKQFTVLHRSAEWLTAFVLAIVTLPMLLVAAAVSAATYGTSPFFTHERLGRGGRPFRFIKIRTLPPATSPYASKFAIPLADTPWAMSFLRRLHLDELPQLWLVLTGHMSLVGPRPEMALLHGQIAEPAAAERLSVRPGITGLWQISIHCDGLIYQRVEYDRLYVRHRTALLDAWILVRTLRKMLFGHRIQLFHVPAWATGPERMVTLAPQNPAPGRAVDIDLIEDVEVVPSLT